MNYIILLKFTEQGIRDIKDSPERVKKAKELFRKHGAEVKNFYLVTGRFDTVLIVDAPDNATLTTCALALSALGNVHTETLCAYNEAEFAKICANL